MVSKLLLCKLLCVLYCCVSLANSDVAIPRQRQLTTYERCPAGFVIPDNPSDPDVEFAADSNCAIGCKSPILGPHTWHTAITFVKTVNLIGLICLLFLFVSVSTLYMGEQRQGESRVLLLLICLFSGLATIITFVQRHRPFQDQFCRDNATPITAKDGVTMCAVESWFSLYSGFGLALAWAVQSFQIMWVLTFHEAPPLSDATIVAMLVLLPLVVDIIVFSSGAQGYSRGSLFCFTNVGAGDNDIYYFFIPIFVVGCLGVLFMCVAIYQICDMLDSRNKRIAPSANFEENMSTRGFIGSPSTRGSGSLSPSEKQPVSIGASIRALYLPLMFVLFFLFCILGLVFGRYEVWSHENKRNELFNTWILCVFDNYDGATDRSWQENCGVEPPSNGVNRDIGAWFGLAAMGHSIFVTIAFFRYKEIWSRISALHLCIISSRSRRDYDEDYATSFVEFDAEVGESQNNFQLASASERKIVKAESDLNNDNNDVEEFVAG